MASPYNLSFEESMTIIGELKNNMSDLEEYPKFKEIIPPYYIFLSDRKNAYLTVTSNVSTIVFRFLKLMKMKSKYL